ncbi:winged helix-turn-helix domain-containing protein [Sulfurimonas sp.]|nr:winged helix-turn-helix domain-containing protein [Sulfurimonas sp.]
MKFLIIDTNKKYSKQIQSYFQLKDIAIDEENSYDNILDNQKHINLNNYDAFIFSISYTDASSLDILDYMKLINLDTPVILIDYDNSIELCSKGFSRGAEDYLHTPFDIKELELRVMKSVRKKVSQQDEIQLPNDYSYMYSDNVVSHRHLGIDLTKKQKALLYLFMTHKNSMVTYEMIQDSVYDGKFFTNNAIATHIRDIKKKIKGIPIKAVKGEGYILKI